MVKQTLFSLVAVWVDTNMVQIFCFVPGLAQKVQKDQNPKMQVNFD